MGSLSRRDFLERLSSAYVAMLAGCRKNAGAVDWFAKERVCIHVFNPQESLPAPLLQQASDALSRPETRDLFTVGLPELVLCSTKKRFLDLFPYFWPFSREDFSQLEKSIEVLYDIKTLAGPADLDKVADYLRKRTQFAAGVSCAVIFTFNDATNQMSPRLVKLCREAKVAELVIFKDPTREPYFCDYPARQRGFKRPPP